MTRHISGVEASGWASGVAGTLALSLMERVERRLLGRAPLYSSTRIAARLSRRAGVSLGPEGERALGALLRWPYGAALALIRGRLSPRRSVARALCFGAGIYAFELLALPATGATPPLRRWPAKEVMLLAAHTLTFALVSELAPLEA